ncbi:hypothetical protein FIU87_03380 [Bacillus sp. THAF10]|nr:hypothetical protein FIU87_03380 [Bacillus sp. THAF10]
MQRIRNRSTSGQGFFEKAHRYTNSYIIRCRTCEYCFIYEAPLATNPNQFIPLQCDYCGTRLCDVNASSTRVITQVY